MKSLLLHTLLATVAVTCPIVAGQAAEITWGAYSVNGVGTSDGVPLPVGDLVMLGSFGSLTPMEISTASFATLQANFTNYDAVARHIGDGEVISGGTTPTSADAGTWYEGNDTNSTLALGIAAQPMYYWVINSSSLSTATQEGVFTAAFDGATSTTRANWVFPSDTAIPPTKNVDIADVVPYSSGTTIDRSGIVIGGYGGSYLDSPLFELAPITVPEPSSYAILLSATAIFLVVRAQMHRMELSANSRQ